MKKFFPQTNCQNLQNFLEDQQPKKLIELLIEISNKQSLQREFIFVLNNLSTNLSKIAISFVRLFMSEEGNKHFRLMMKILLQSKDLAYEISNCFFLDKEIFIKKIISYEEKNISCQEKLSVRLYILDLLEQYPDHLSKISWVNYFYSENFSDETLKNHFNILLYLFLIDWHQSYKPDQINPFLNEQNQDKISQSFTFKEEKHRDFIEKYRVNKSFSMITDKKYSDEQIKFFKVKIIKDTSKNILGHN